MQCFMKKKDKSLLDVENIETTGVFNKCCHLSRRTPLNCSLCMFIGMKHISPTFRYIIPMYLRLKTFTKTLPQMSFHLICCYLFGSGAPFITLLAAGVLTDLQLPATASNVCTADEGWVASAGWPPKQQSWLRRCGQAVKVLTLDFAVLTCCFTPLSLNQEKGTIVILSPL